VMGGDIRLGHGRGGARGSLRGSVGRTRGPGARGSPVCMTIVAGISTYYKNKIKNDITRRVQVGRQYAKECIKDRTLRQGKWAGHAYFMNAGVTGTVSLGFATLMCAGPVTRTFLPGVCVNGGPSGSSSSSLPGHDSDGLGARTRMGVLLACRAKSALIQMCPHNPSHRYKCVQSAGSTAARAGNYHKGNIGPQQTMENGRLGVRVPARDRTPMGVWKVSIL
jgi:hypothetical protein